MRKKNYKRRCEKVALSKCQGVSKTYDPIQMAYARMLQEDSNISEFWCTLTEIYTHNTELKKRLLAYATKFPELCKQTDDDGQGGLRFEITKERISIRLTAPYSQERRDAASRLAKKTNTFIKTRSI